MPDGYMTIAEVRDSLRLSDSTVRRMLRDGRLPGVQVAGRWRIPRSAVEALLTERETTQADSDEGEMWARVAMEKFQWLCRVARLRGATVHVDCFQCGSEPSNWIGAGGHVNGEKAIFVNIDEGIIQVGRLVFEDLGNTKGANLAACEWISAIWVLLHEMGHVELHPDCDVERHRTDSSYRDTIEGEARMFARRMLAEFKADGNITEEEAAELCGKIAERIIAERAAQ